ncbi:histidine phosphatase family protein, partial [Mycobacterium tuberculosis]
MPEETQVHVVRHGEVHNPTGILYGRLPGFHLSATGAAQAAAVADALADRDIVAVIASPLQRAQETAAPIAARHDLAVETDPDLIESVKWGPKNAKAFTIKMRKLTEYGSRSVKTPKQITGNGKY